MNDSLEEFEPKESSSPLAKTIFFLLIGVEVCQVIYVFYNKGF